ncbi:MAG: DUF2848 domain-containing protein [Gammaproteobacteria bacterium]|nr:DUF2848 domain-containing protein [Gammaproteobacteria bacterium]MBU1439705.1 DUF2848 domain-containing protein [Gammaproteobacteria bacterium]MBU2286272.1 DUF2848 domain-containing protein [Gammaproteobacteria bacterium]MBU2410787.1 DUF2848 domain-containing protein [Gammaproteobacteria bacterium]
MKLEFALPDGHVAEVIVRQVLNAGFSGRTREAVAAHVEELQRLGVAVPTVTPIMMPVSPYLAQQTDRVWAPHGHTSGEVEWCLVVADGGELLLTLACDHTDRALEVHGIQWSKNASPDVLSMGAWRFADIEPHIDQLTLKAWVTHAGVEHEIQSSPLSELLPPSYWIELLRGRQLLEPGTLLLSGTVKMHHGVDQFADAWRAEMSDPVLGRTLSLGYAVERLPEPIC